MNRLIRMIRMIRDGENISSLLTIAIGIVVLFLDVFGVISQSVIQQTILLVLIFISIQLLNLDLQTKYNLDEIRGQLMEGDPNAVIKTSKHHRAMAEVAEFASKDLLLVGQSFEGFLSSESHVLIEKINKGVQVRIAILDYRDENLLNQTSGIEKITREEIRGNIEYTLLQLGKINKLLSNPKLLEIRLVRTPITISGLQSDKNDLFISVLPLALTSLSQGPYFLLNRSRSRDLFDNFSEALESIWQQAKLIEFSSVS